MLGDRSRFATSRRVRSAETALVLVALHAGTALAQTPMANAPASASFAQGDGPREEANVRRAEGKASARRSDWIKKPATPDGIGVFTQPLGSLMMGAGAIVYVPLGMNLPISERSEVVVEVTATSGDWYGCESDTTGGWAALGIAWFVTPRKWLSRGAFLQPKLVVRHFDTDGAREVAPRRKHAGCTASDAANIDGSDYELHAGLDAGYSMRVGMLELAFVVGLTAGLCHSCFSDRVFFWRQADIASLLYEPPPPRTNRLSLGLNLNLLRLGARF